MLAVEHQHRFAVWGGAGNRTLALTSTASRAATDTSATVVLVWVLGFEPRASSVQGRHSGQAELHPDLSVTSFRSPFRLSAWLSLFRTVGRGRDQAPSSALPGAPRISWRGWQESHLRAVVLETAPPLRAHPRLSWLPGQASNLERPD